MGKAMPIPLRLNTRLLENSLVLAWVGDSLEDAVAFSADEIARIIQTELPGYKIVSKPPASDAVTAMPTSGTPNLGALKLKYRSPADENIRLGESAPLEESVPQEEGDVMVTVEPENAGDAWTGPHAKVVIISGKTKKIKGFQG
jgi:hypothetical protein